MLFDLRPRTMHQYQPDAQCGEQVEVMSEFDELAIGHHFAAKGDDEGLATEGVDIGRDGTKPGDEISGGGLDGHSGLSESCTHHAALRLI